MPLNTIFKWVHSGLNPQKTFAWAHFCYHPYISFSVLRVTAFQRMLYATIAFAFIVSCNRHMCPVHFNLLDLIVLILSQSYKSLAHNLIESSQIESYLLRCWQVLYTSVTLHESNRCSWGYAFLTSSWVGFDPANEPAAYTLLLHLYYLRHTYFSETVYTRMNWTSLFFATTFALVSLYIRTADNDSVCRPKIVIAF
jgi:hypothetical protein